MKFDHYESLIGIYYGQLKIFTIIFNIIKFVYEIISILLIKEHMTWQDSN